MCQLEIWIMSKALMSLYFKIKNSPMLSHVLSASEYLGTQFISINVNISSANAAFRNHFITSARIPPNSLLKSAECPCCNSWFLKSEAIPFEEFNYAMKKVYHLVRLRCPYGCDFIADPLQMDDH